MKRQLHLLIFIVCGFLACKKDSPEVKAEFRVKKTTFYLLEPVEFMNVSAQGVYLWDFGDKQTSTDVSPVHTYTKPGTYNVSLTLNGQVTEVKTIVVYASVSSYVVVNNTGFDGLEVTAYYSDINGRVADSVKLGTLAALAKSDTVFTAATLIKLGGVQMGKRTSTEYPLLRNTNNVLSMQ